jgi:regulatory protein
VNEITSILPQVKDKKRCNIYVDGRFCCGLTLEATVKNRLKVGMVITPERLSQIQLESEKNTAMDKALHFISATRKTQEQVKTYLQGKGYLPAVIEYVLEKLKGYDFLNDAEYAKDYVSFSAGRKGAKLIKLQLRAKGLSGEDIDGAMATLEPKMQEDAAKSILEKYMRHKTADRETLAKAFKYLLSKGFDYDVARGALGTLGDVEEE